MVWAGKGSTYLTLHPRLWLGARTGSINLWQGRWGVWLPSPAPCLEPQPPPELSFWKLLGNPVCGTPPPPPDTGGSGLGGVWGDGCTQLSQVRLLFVFSVGLMGTASLIDFSSKLFQAYEKLSIIIKA